MTVSGMVMTNPEHCQYETSSLSEPMTKTGTCISKTWILCPMPAFHLNIDFQPMNKCSGTDLASSHCTFEDDVPSLGLQRRFYSLVLPRWRMKFSADGAMMFHQLHQSSTLALHENDFGC
jgi:hypothetical protein